MGTSNIDWLLRPNFKDRIRRRQFWIGYIGHMFASYLILLIGQLPLAMASGAPKILSMIIAILMVVMFVAVCIYSITMIISLFVRRLHDMNKHGALALMMIIPFVCALVFFWLGLAPSKNENNPYGVRQYPD